VETPRPHRHHHAHWHSMTHEVSWASSASSVSSYSESREYEYGSVSHSMGGDEQGPAAYPPPPPSVGSEVWVDGYGRSHYASGGMAGDADRNPAPLSVEDAHQRLDPWRGYDANCPDARD
jgi:hypothetical protein